MIILHGIDRYGRIDSIDGEYLVTRFIHLYLMPIVPVGSEWVVAREGNALFGVRCRLSWRSVLVGYLRAWGIVVALGLVGLSLLGVRSALVAAVALGAVVAGSFRGRRQRDERARRRVALQRRVIGMALDPRQLKPADAAKMLPAAEARFAVVSAGRTALDVARGGATSEAQAAHAFVVLRLMAACERRTRAAELTAASERILDGGAIAAAEQPPYREAAAVAVAPPAPLVHGDWLRPHRLRGALATIGFWVFTVTSALQMRGHLRVCAYDKREIAEATTHRLAREAFPHWTAEHPGVCPTAVDLAEYSGSAKDPWGTPYHVRCQHLPDGTIAAKVWSAGPDERDNRGFADDIGDVSHPGIAP